VVVFKKWRQDLGTIFFSGSEIVELGIRIEKNGRDFYKTLVEQSQHPEAKKIFQYLTEEEEKHIAVFQNILEALPKYKPTESYPEEYFSYLRALSEELVFTKEKTGGEIAQRIKTEREAVELAIGFERDSILFYYEIKKAVLGSEQKIVDKLIEQEQEHLRKLSELKRIF